MCGLAGYINLSKAEFNAEPALLDAVQQTIAHRGPNGYRTWVSTLHKLALVHRRLSIVDLSDIAFQPMVDKENTVVVACNGEIYNHPQLRKELESLGHRYYSNSDTETILYAYKQWGIKFLDSLEGMFSIILFDMRSNELYLVRDRIGIKPLYFSMQGGVLSFASEIKALWPMPWMQKSLNSRALYHYLTFMVTPAPMTLYAGIYKLPAAHYIKVDAHRNVTFHEWYNPIAAIAGQPAVTDEAVAVKTVRTMLRDSIKKHMMSDVPYGVFLSGGIDSSLNVGLMAEFTDQVKTFNVSFSDGPEYSEMNWARKVANRFNTQHHEIVIGEKEAFEFFQKMVYYQDEPIADCVCVPLYYVSKLLKDSGVTVVQVGEGSDELFCGYSTYAQYLEIYKRYWQPSQRLIPTFFKRGIYQLLKPAYQGKLQRRDMLNTWSQERHFFWGGAIAFSELWKKDFVADATPDFDPIIDQVYPGFNQNLDSYAVVEYHLKKLYELKPDADFLTSMIYLELKQRLPELLLMRVDKMAMATAVEGRVPFLDHKFVEYALRISPELKYKNGVTKYVLKKAAEGILPHEVIYRKKMGFAAPITRWFKQGHYFKPFFQDMLQSSNTTWQDALNIPNIQALYAKNQHPHQDYAVQLWVLQNLMAQQL